MKNNLPLPCDCLNCENKCIFFLRLTETEFAKLNQSKSVVTFHKGDVIVKKDTINPHVYLISKGLVKINAATDLQKNFLLELLTPKHLLLGNIFGNSTNFFTAIALTDVVICKLQSDIFHDLLEANGKFSCDLLKYSNIQSAARFHRLHSITLKQSRGKVADVLLYLTKLDHQEPVFRHLSRQDLADMANISMENAIRTLKEFTVEGLISIDRKDIHILHADGLRRVSQIG